MRNLLEIRERLGTRARRERLGDAVSRAAVALVLRDGPAGSELLFIERAQHPMDPWSGHMAFPGGRIDAGDRDDRGAAERETLEEVGVRLSEASYLGHLQDLSGNPAGRPGLVVSAHVYHAPRPEVLVPNHEVAAAFWFPVERLADPARRVEFAPSPDSGRRFPGICVGDPDRHVVWGLTYRFLQTFAREAGLPPLR